MMLNEDTTHNLSIILERVSRHFGLNSPSDILQIGVEDKNFQLTAFTNPPRIIALHFSDENLKQHVFPAIESAGYRMFIEKGPHVVFFLVATSAIELSEKYAVGAPKIIENFKGTKWEKHPVIGGSCGQMIEIKAAELMCVARFDIALKAHYARLWRDNMAEEWRESVYSAQAMRITGAGKHIKEYDGSGKVGLKSFLDNFHSLLKEKDTNKFPLVPIDKDNIAIDGAHRIAAAIQNNQKIKAIKFDKPSKIFVGPEFYLNNNNGHAPCDAAIIDEGFIEYCRIKDTAAIALIFPSAKNHQRAIDVLTSHADVICIKEIDMNEAAGRVLLRQAYLGQPWIGWSEDQSGFNNKVKSCFPFSGKMSAVLIDNFDPKKIRDVKEEVRALYKLSKHSIHMTDSRDETLRVARALFNQNSVHLLEKPNKDFSPEFHDKLFKFKKWVEQENINPDHICLDSSAILSVYGLRACRDLDFLYHGDPEKLQNMPDKVGCHNDLAHYYSKPIDAILGDPRHHFWYMDVKFVSPALVYNMKKNRGENKDRQDNLMLKQILPVKRWKGLHSLVSMLQHEIGRRYFALRLIAYKIKLKIKETILK